jgi:hypothetical protein
MPIVWALGNAGFKPRLKVSRWCVSDPLARFARVSPHEGEINACKASFVLPLVRGRAAEGGRGSFTHHLESWLHSVAATRPEVP